MDISLIICTKDRSEMLEDVLISAQNQVSSLSYEVIIVDDSSNNKTKNLLEKYPKFTYLEGSQQGLAEARNRGFRSSNGNIIVFVDDDVFFNKYYLQNIYDFFLKSPIKPDFAGGKTHLKFLVRQPEWIDGNLLGVLAYSDYGSEEMLYDNHPKHVPYGCNMAIKRELLEKAGGFSASIHDLENEDIILAHKIREMGYNLAYCPQMFLYHKIPAKRMTYIYYKTRYYIQGKSDTYTYYDLHLFLDKEIPNKIFIHAYRMIKSLVLRYFKKNSSEIFYQKLRLYYNLGCIEELISILSLKKDKKKSAGEINSENTRISGERTV